MKNLLFSFLFCFVAIVLNAQSVVHHNSFKLGASGADSPVSIKTTTNGDFIVAGNFEGVADFDPSAATATLSALGQGDIFIAKYDALGNFIWVKQIGSVGGEQIADMDIDAAGNIIIGGVLAYELDMNPAAAVYTLNLTYVNNVEGFVAKYDANGNFTWAKKVQVMNNSSFTRVSKLDVNLNNEIFITGYFTGTIGFDNSGSVSTRTGPGGSDIYFSRISSAGTFLYSGVIGGANADNVFGIAANSANEVIIGGKYQSTNFDINPTATTNSLALTGGTDGFIAKYNSTGDLLFGFSLGGFSNDQVSTCTFDNNGNVIVAGLFMNTVDFDPSASTSTISLASSMGVCMASYNSSGVFLWAKKISTSSINTDASNIYTDASNNILLSGVFYGINDFDPSVSSTYSLSATGAADAFYASYTSIGNLNWAFNLGGTASENAPDLAFFNDTYYVTGDYASTIDMDPSAATSTLNFNTGTDIFVGIYTYTCIPPANPINTTPNASLTICAGKTTTLTVSGNGTLNWFDSPTSTSVIATGTSYIVSNLAAGTYTYYVEASTCTVSAGRTPIVVTVNVLPNVVISGVNPICIGSPAILTASGALTYTWSNTVTTNTISVGIMVDATFTVTGRDANGCRNTAIQTVTVSQLPIVIINSSPSSVCLGESVTLSANGATTYTWSNAEIGITTTVTPTGTTSYSVVGANSFGCKNSATKSVSVLSLPTLTISGTTWVCKGSSTILTASGASSYVWSTSANTSSASVSPTVNTVYSVVGTAANNCTNTKTITVSVVARPSITVTSSNGNPICNDGSGTYLMASGANTYTWSGSLYSGAVIPANSSISLTYTVTGTALTTCTNTQTISIVVNPLPILNVFSSSPVLCSGQTATLSANGANTYTWNTTENTADILISPTSNTNYTVTGVDANNCSSKSVYTQNVSVCTDINENVVQLNSILIYPNPNNGQFIIQSQVSDIITITNELSQVVQTIELNYGNNFSYQITDLQNGIYFLAGKTVKQKVIVSGN